MSETYPKRPQFFAIHFTRLLFRAAVVNDLGDKAVLLLIRIALKEDAKFYAGPVTYWNEQLQDMLGIGHSQFAAIRRSAVDAGWLHYEKGGRHRAARYWVTVPPNYQRMMAADPAVLSSGGPEVGPEFGPESNFPSSGRPEFGPELNRNLDRKPSYPNPKPNPKNNNAAYVFPVKGNGDGWPLPDSKVSEYRETFPNVDIEAELLKARQWCRDNPDKRKTARGMPRFLNQWLTNAKPGESEESEYRMLDPVLDLSDEPEYQR